MFLEVPRESPLGLSRMFRRIAQIGIVALTRPVLARYMLRPASLYVMHEHINYFSEQSLTTLMRSCGCAVTGVGSYVMDSGVEKAPMVWCLGTVN